MHGIPGCERFFLGNLPTMKEYAGKVDKVKEDPSQDAMWPAINYIFDWSTESKEKDSYDFTTN